MTKFQLTQEEIDNIIPLLSNKNFDGIAWIGDPHYTEKAPSKRTDDFLNTIMNKMAGISDMVQKKNLYPVILGDLIDKEKEFSRRLLGSVIKSLKRFSDIPLTIIGNHDTKTVDFLTDSNVIPLLDDSEINTKDVFIEEHHNVINILEDTGIIHLIRESGLIGRIRVKDKVVALGGIPYGGIWNESLVLDWLKEKFPDKKWKQFNYDLKTLLAVDYILLVSHDNLPFLGANIPAIVDIKKLNEVDMVVNGHIHSPLKPLNLDGMYIHNPGNIIRMSLGAGYGAGKIYKPGFSIWNGEDSFDSLERIDIPHKRAEEVFDISGRHAGTQKLRALNDVMNDKFTSALHNAVDSGNGRTDYIPDLAKMIKSVGESLPLQARKELSALFVEVVDPNNVLGNVDDVFVYYLDNNSTEENKQEIL